MMQSRVSSSQSMPTLRSETRALSVSSATSASVALAPSESTGAAASTGQWRRKRGAGGTWVTIPVYICSDQRTMAAERELLQSSVFPEANRRIANRLVQLVPVCLRWGMDADESRAGQFANCVRAAGEAGGFVVVLSPGVYGEAPTADEIAEASLKKMPWYNSRAFAHLSMQHLELHAGVLSRFPEDGPAQSHLLAYFRSNAFGASVPVGETAAAEVHLKSSGLAEELFKGFVQEIEEFPGARTFKGYPCSFKNGRIRGLSAFRLRVVQDLVEAVVAEFPSQPEELGGFELESHYHEALVNQHRSRKTALFCGREDELAAIVAHCLMPNEDAPSSPLFVLGGRGMGKTTLLSRAVQKVRSEIQRVGDRKAAVVPLFVGASPRSGDPRLCMLHVLFMACRAVDRHPDVAWTRLTANDLGLVIMRVVAEARDTNIVIVLDGTDSWAMSELLSNASWYLPFRMSDYPPNLRVVVGLTEGSELVRDFREPRIGAAVFAKDDEEPARMPSECLPAMPPPVTLGAFQPAAASAVLTIVTDRNAAANLTSVEASELADALAVNKEGWRVPLWLTTAAQNLLQSDHASLKDAAKALPHDVEALFDHIIAQVEEKHGLGVTRRVLSVLALADHGIVEGDMLRLLKRTNRGETILPRGAWVNMHRSIAMFLSPVDPSGFGRLRLQSPHMRLAVRKRYLVTCWSNCFRFQSGCLCSHVTNMGTPEPVKWAHKDGKMYGRLEEAMELRLNPQTDQATEWSQGVAFDYLDYLEVLLLSGKMSKIDKLLRHAPFMRNVSLLRDRAQLSEFCAQLSLTVHIQDRFAALANVVAQASPGLVYEKQELLDLIDLAEDEKANLGRLRERVGSEGRLTFKQVSDFLHAWVQRSLPAEIEGVVSFPTPNAVAVANKRRQLEMEMGKIEALAMLDEAPADEAELARWVDIVENMYTHHVLHESQVYSNDGRMWQLQAAVLQNGALTFRLAEKGKALALALVTNEQLMKLAPAAPAGNGLVKVSVFSHETDVVRARCALLFKPMRAKKSGEEKMRVCGIEFEIGTDAFADPYVLRVLIKREKQGYLRKAKGWKVTAKEVKQNPAVANFFDMAKYTAPENEIRQDDDVQALQVKVNEKVTVKKFSSEGGGGIARMSLARPVTCVQFVQTVTSVLRIFVDVVVENVTRSKTFYLGGAESGWRAPGEVDEYIMDQAERTVVQAVPTSMMDAFKYAPLREQDFQKIANNIDEDAVELRPGMAVVVAIPVDIEIGDLFMDFHLSSLNDKIPLDMPQPLEIKVVLNPGEDTEISLVALQHNQYANAIGTMATKESLYKRFCGEFAADCPIDNCRFVYLDDMETLLRQCLFAYWDPLEDTIVIKISRGGAFFSGNLDAEEIAQEALEEGEEVGHWDTFDKLPDDGTRLTFMVDISNEEAPICWGGKLEVQARTGEATLYFTLPGRPIGLDQRIENETVGVSREKLELRQWREEQGLETVYPGMVPENLLAGPSLDPNVHRDLNGVAGTLLSSGYEGNGVQIRPIAREAEFAIITSQLEFTVEAGFSVSNMTDKATTVVLFEAGFRSGAAEEWVETRFVMGDVKVSKSRKSSRFVFRPVNVIITLAAFQSKNFAVRWYLPLTKVPEQESRVPLIPEELPQRLRMYVRGRRVESQGEFRVESVVENPQPRVVTRASMALSLGLSDPEDLTFMSCDDCEGRYRIAYASYADPETGEFRVVRDGKEPALPDWRAIGAKGVETSQTLVEVTRGFLSPERSRYTGRVWAMVDLVNGSVFGLKVAIRTLTSTAVFYDVKDISRTARNVSIGPALRASGLMGLSALGEGHAEVKNALVEWSQRGAGVPYTLRVGPELKDDDPVLVPLDAVLTVDRSKQTATRKRHVRAGGGRRHSVLASKDDSSDTITIRLAEGFGVTGGSVPFAAFDAFTTRLVVVNSSEKEAGIVSISGMYRGKSGELMPCRVDVSDCDMKHGGEERNLPGWSWLNLQPREARTVRVTWVVYPDGPGEPSANKNRMNTCFDDPLELSLVARDARDARFRLALQFTNGPIKVPSSERILEKLRRRFAGMNVETAVISRCDNVQSEQRAYYVVFWDSKLRGWVVVSPSGRMVLVRAERPSADTKVKLGDSSLPDLVQTSMSNRRTPLVCWDSTLVVQQPRLSCAAWMLMDYSGSAVPTPVGFKFFIRTSTSTVTSYVPLPAMTKGSSRGSLSKRASAVL